MEYTTHTLKDWSKKSVRSNTPGVEENVNIR